MIPKERHYKSDFFEKRQNSKFIVKNYTENSQLEKHIDVILHLILPVFFYQNMNCHTQIRN